MALKVKSQNTDFDARWFDYEGGISFKIGSIDKDEYRIGIERARRIIDRKESSLDLHNLKIDSNDRSEQDLQAELMGRYIILDWKGDIQDEEGNQLAYSPEAASNLLRSVPSLISWVAFKAVEVALDIAEEQKEIVGKSSSASSGKKTGVPKPKSES